MKFWRRVRYQKIAVNLQLNFSNINEFDGVYGSVFQEIIFHQKNESKHLIFYQRKVLAVWKVNANSKMWPISLKTFTLTNFQISSYYFLTRQVFNHKSSFPYERTYFKTLLTGGILNFFTFVAITSQIHVQNSHCNMLICSTHHGE